MATTLLWVRHAKAKVGAEGQPDFDRELSEAGKRAFNASAESQLAAPSGAIVPVTPELPTRTTGSPVSTARATDCQAC